MDEQQSEPHTNAGEAVPAQDTMAASDYLEALQSRLVGSDVTDRDIEALHALGEWLDSWTAPPTTVAVD